MTTMLYVAMTIAVLVVALLMLRLRLRVEFSSSRHLLFAGLGRSGTELDFSQKKGSLRLFGFSVHTFETSREAPEATKEAGKKARPKKARRKPSVAQILRIIPDCSVALWRYTVGLLRATLVEQADGEIQGGFDSPDLTGQAYGYYQAALAAAPAVVGRVRYTPDWEGASFSGAVRLAVALPLYRFVFLSLLLLWRLPVIEIIRLAIGRSKGVKDGQQRS